MTAQIDSMIDLSPAVFGDDHDLVTIQARVVDAYADFDELLHEPMGTASQPVAHLIVALPQEASKAKVWTHTWRGDGVRVTLLDLPSPAVGHEALTRALFPAVHGVALSLRQGQTLQIIWPESHSVEALRDAVQRALRWRSAWTEPDEADGVTKPMHMT